MPGTGGAALPPRFPVGVPGAGGADHMGVQSSVTWTQNTLKAKVQGTPSFKDGRTLIYMRQVRYRLVESDASENDHSRDSLAVNRTCRRTSSSDQDGPTRVTSVQLLSRVRLFVTPGIAARQASLSITNSQSSLRLTSIESVMPSSHLILCCPLFLLPPIPPSIRVFSNESTLLVILII